MHSFFAFLIVFNVQRRHMSPRL